MCRAGGRRCKGSASSSRATQNTRKERSRAKHALRKAKASGDDDAIRKATERLDAANAAHTAAKENAMHHNDNDTGGSTPGQERDVTASEAAALLREMREEMKQREQAARTAAASRSHAVTNVHTGNFVGVQSGIIVGEVHVNGRRVQSGTAVQQGDVTSSGTKHKDPSSSAGVHTGRSGFQVTNVAYGDVGVQSGVITGAVIVNGRVVSPGQAATSGGISAEEGQRAQDKARRTADKAQRMAERAREQARRARDSARQSGDVTTSTFRTSSGGTVTNIVYGQNHGIQTDVVNGPIHFGPGGFTTGKPQDGDQ